jgi:hypothetical protein
VTTSNEGSNPDLKALARSLELAAPGPIVALRCVSGHPVYLVISERVPKGDAVYDWTNTNLPLLEVGPPITDVTRDKCIALLYALEAHALGLPLPAHLETPYAEAIETCALIRGHDRFVQDRHLVDFLGVEPNPVRNLIHALTNSLPIVGTATGHRLAAVMIEANVFPTVRVELGTLLGTVFRGVEAVASTIRVADPTHATNEMMRWIGVSAPSYAYRQDRGATTKQPRVHALDEVFDAVLSSTRRNRKDFNLELEHLQKHMRTQWVRPYVGLDHDRTIAPVAIVVGSHISRSEHEGAEQFELHARIAGLHERGTKMLAQKGGLSIAFHEGRNHGQH